MSGIHIDKKSIERALKQSNFPETYDLNDIADALERDVMDALHARNVKSGSFKVKLGEIQFDITDEGIKPVKIAKKPRKKKRKKIINKRNRK